MKKYLLFVPIVSILLSCGINDDLIDLNSLEPYQSEFLKFENFEEFERTLEESSNANSFENFRSLSTIEEENENRSKLWDYLNEDGLVKIGEYIMKLDFENEVLAYVTDESKVNLLVKSQYNSDEVNLFSFYDDVLFLLSEGVPNTLNSINEANEYNLKSKEELEKNFRLQNNWTWNCSVAPIAPLMNEKAPFRFHETLPSCNFYQGGFGTWRRSVHVDVIGHPNYVGPAGNALWRDFNLIVERRYIANAVYFELRLEIKYETNTQASNGVSRTNAELILQPRYIYERRRRFQSNEVNQEDMAPIVRPNASSIRSILYSGSRSLVYFGVEYTVSYRTETGSCGPIQTRTFCGQWWSN